VAGRLRPWRIDDVLAAAEQTNDAGRKIGKGLRIGGLPAIQKRGERDRIGGFRKSLAQLFRERADAIPALGLLHHAPQ
jgi:hypothetical protein